MTTQAKSGAGRILLAALPVVCGALGMAVGLSAGAAQLSVDGLGGAAASLGSALPVFVGIAVAFTIADAALLYAYGRDRSMSAAIPALAVGLLLLGILVVLRQPGPGTSLVTMLGASADRAPLLAWWGQLIAGWVGASLLSSVGIGLAIAPTLGGRRSEGGAPALPMMRTVPPPSRAELASAGVHAARSVEHDLRTIVASLPPAASLPPELIEELDELTELSDDLATISEQDPEQMVRALGGALTRMDNTLKSLRAAAPNDRIEAVATAVAHGMATLHPAKRELEVTLHPERKARPPKPVSSRPPPPMPGSVDGERRRAPRVELDAEIGFQSETNFFTGFAGDLSDGGLFIATYDVLPIGTEISVSFVLPDRTRARAVGDLVSITVQGRVAWVREPAGFEAELHPGMGVAFHDLGPDDRAAVLRFLRQREPLFYDGE